MSLNDVLHKCVEKEKRLFPESRYEPLKMPIPELLRVWEPYVAMVARDPSSLLELGREFSAEGYGLLNKATQHALSRFYETYQKEALALLKKVYDAAIAVRDSSLSSELNRDFSAKDDEIIKKAIGDALLRFDEVHQKEAFALLEEVYDVVLVSDPPSPSEPSSRSDLKLGKDFGEKEYRIINNATRNALLQLEGMYRKEAFTVLKAVYNSSDFPIAFSKVFERSKVVTLDENGNDIIEMRDLPVELKKGAPAPTAEWEIYLLEKSDGKENAKEIYGFLHLIEKSIAANSWSHYRKCVMRNPSLLSLIVQEGEAELLYLIGKHVYPDFYEATRCALIDYYHEHEEDLGVLKHVVIRGMEDVERVKKDVSNMDPNKYDNDKEPEKGLVFPVFIEEVVKGIILHHSLKVRDSKKIEDVLETEPIDFCIKGKKDGETAFQLAVRERYEDVICKIIKRSSATLTLENKKGETMLETIAKQGSVMVSKESLPLFINRLLPPYSDARKARLEQCLQYKTPGVAERIAHEALPRKYLDKGDPPVPFEKFQSFSKLILSFLTARSALRLCLDGGLWEKVIAALRKDLKKNEKGEYAYKIHLQTHFTTKILNKLRHQDEQDFTQRVDRLSSNEKGKIAGLQEAYGLIKAVEHEHLFEREGVRPSQLAFSSSAPEASFLAHMLVTEATKLWRKTKEGHAQVISPKKKTHMVEVITHMIEEIPGIKETLQKNSVVENAALYLLLGTFTLKPWALPTRSIADTDISKDSMKGLKKAFAENACNNNASTTMQILAERKQVEQYEATVFAKMDELFRHPESAEKVLKDAKAELQNKHKLSENIMERLEKDKEEDKRPVRRGTGTKPRELTIRDARGY